MQNATKSSVNRKFFKRYMEFFVLLLGLLCLNDMQNLFNSTHVEHI